MATTPLDPLLLDASAYAHADLLATAYYWEVLQAVMVTTNPTTSNESSLPEKLAALAASLSARDTLALVAASLLLFLQLNTTGPAAALPTDDEIVRDCAILGPDHHAAALDYLSADGEPAYHLARRPALLALAVALTTTENTESPLLAWWHARAQRVRMTLLDAVAPSLRESALSALARAESLATTTPKSRDLAAVWHLERAAIVLGANDLDQALALADLDAARTVTGLEVEVTGVLGKRTKFQETSLTQLVVMAESRSEPLEAVEDARVDTLLLNDDTILEKPALEGDTHRATVNLRIIDQCLLLGYFQHLKNTNPANNEMTDEQMMPYIRRVLENPNNWTVHSVALLQRSRLEAKRSRTVERGALQMQTLVDQIDAVTLDTDAPAHQRLRWIFAVDVPPRWALEREVADAWLALGMARTALDMYERLEMWDKAVVCHMLTERADKAEELVVKQLKTAPQSPKLLALLGDIRGDPSFYTDAWAASGNRYARAQRSLGSYHFKRGSYPEAVAAYQLALAINPMFEDAWFVYGCAALHTSQWEVAATAFSRCTAMDLTNGEAWNNLASVYVRMGKKEQAYSALMQGVKHKHDSWRMWTNAMAIAADLGKLDEALLALSRVVAIRAAHASADVRAGAVDVEMLNRLVTLFLILHLEKPIPDRIVRVAHVVTQCTNAAPASHDVWMAAAQFHTKRRDYRRALDAHVRAFRCVARESYEDEAQVRAVVDAASELCDAYFNFGDQRMGRADIDDEVAEPTSREVACEDWAYQAKLVVRGLLGRVKDFEDTPPHDSLRELFEKVKEWSR